jgi:hypothetical protein
MVREAELSEVDVRYEDHRLMDPRREAKLLLSIQEHGIREPLEGVDVQSGKVLLNGFKRYRCARRLGLGVVPWASLGEDEATGIIALMRASHDRALGILEQARFIDDLYHCHELSVAGIAEALSRSKGWVGMRLGLIAEMSETVRQHVFSGAFPVYSYMYAVRPFMRMNAAPRREVEAFVRAVSGKRLSVRAIEQLAQGYFKGSEWLREQIRCGKLTLALESLRPAPAHGDECSPSERGLLRDLEVLQRYMQRTLTKSADARLGTPPFRVQANLLVAGILSCVDALTAALRELHDRTGEA